MISKEETMKPRTAIFILTALVSASCPCIAVRADEQEFSRMSDSEMLETGKRLEESGDCERAADLYLEVIKSGSRQAQAAKARGECQSVESCPGEYQRPMVLAMNRLFDVPINPVCPEKQRDRVSERPALLGLLKATVVSSEISVPQLEQRVTLVCLKRGKPECAKAQKDLAATHRQVAHWQWKLTHKYFTGKGAPQDKAEAAWWLYQSILSYGRAGDESEVAEGTDILRQLATEGNGAAKEYVLELNKWERAKARSRIEEQGPMPEPWGRGKMK